MNSVALFLEKIGLLNEKIAFNVFFVFDGWSLWV